MSIYKDIRAALEGRLASTPNLPAIAWENVPYSSTTGTPFVKPLFQPTLRRQSAMATVPPHYYQGIFTILCYYPEGTGPGDSQETVDNLVNRFESTTDISYTNPDLETLIVSIRGVQQESSYISSPWYVTPITVSWFIYDT
jgi:hypothetical protein